MPPPLPSSLLVFLSLLVTYYGFYCLILSLHNATSNAMSSYLFARSCDPQCCQHFEESGDHRCFMHRVQVTHVTPRSVPPPVTATAPVCTLMLAHPLALSHMCTHTQFCIAMRARTHTHAPSKPLISISSLFFFDNFRRHRIWNCGSRHSSLLSRQETVCQEGRVRTLNNDPLTPKSGPRSAEQAGQCP